MEFNLECLQILDFFGYLDEFETLVVISPDEDEENTDEWSGVISILRNFTKQLFVKHASRNQAIQANIKAEIKKEIQATKAEIQARKLQEQISI